MKYLNALHACSLPFYVIMFDLASEGEFDKEVFMVLTNSSHNY